MPKDLTIRLLGRPQVTEDDQVGYHKVTRQYVIEGYRAEYAEVNHPQNPLFLPVGTEDEEYSEHYLVDQKITPAQGTLDNAYLVRVYAEIRDTHVQESVQATNDLKRIRRTYVVLRAQKTKGYDPASWANHPQNNSSDNTKEPWDYAPPVIKSPAEPGYTSSEFTVNGKTPTFDLPEDDTTTHVSAYQTLSSYDSFNTGVWLKGSAQVSMSQPGVDVWSVEWITHSNSYQTSGLKRTGSSGFKPPKIVKLDANGLSIVDLGSGSGSSLLNQVSSYVAFFVAENIPTGLLNSWGGSTNFTPSVMLDFYLEGYEHGNGFSKHSSMPNTIYQIDTNAEIKFPNYSQLRAFYYNGSTDFTKVVAKKNPGEIVFQGDFWAQAQIDGAWYNLVKDEYGNLVWGDDGEPLKEDVSTEADHIRELPHFKGKPIRHAGGKITWNRPIIALTNYATLLGVTVTPVASSGDKNDNRKIWRVVTTYAG